MKILYNSLIINLGMIEFEYRQSGTRPTTLTPKA